MTFDKVAEMIADYKGIEIDTIKPESTFPEMKLDSLDLADLAMNLEDEFGVTIELSPDIKTLADLVRVIDEAEDA